jgi:hypothetical protein
MEMNVTDVKSPPLHGDLRQYALAMVERQSELEEVYWKIENRPAKFITPLDRNGQVLIKDFLWRITEEIGETLEADTKGEPEDKVWEELADALHFVIGLCVITSRTGIFVKAFSQGDYHYPRVGCIANYVESAGKLGNTLKMKPWKQTDVITDVDNFDRLLEYMIVNFLGICWSFQMNPDTLYDYYWRKSEVNKFRIASMY